MGLGGASLLGGVFGAKSHVMSGAGLPSSFRSLWTRAVHSLPSRTGSQPPGSSTGRTWTLPAVLFTAISNLKMQLRPTGLGLWGVEEGSPRYFPPLACSHPVPHPSSGIWLRLDRFPSYFLNGEPGPVGFVESSPRGLSLGSRASCASGDREGGGCCW